MSKKALKKQQKEAEKAAKKEQHKADAAANAQVRIHTIKSHYTVPRYTTNPAYCLLIIWYRLCTIEKQ